LKPRQIRVVEHLGFHFRLKSEIVRVLLRHWFLTELLVLRSLGFLIG